MGPVERKLSASEGEGTVAASVSAPPNIHRQMSGPIAQVNCSQGWFPLAWL